MNIEIIKNINTFEGSIPTGEELVIFEKGNPEESAMNLLGFEEIGEFDHFFKNPIYGFTKTNKAPFLDLVEIVDATDHETGKDCVGLCYSCNEETWQDKL
tara:strand:+ start:1275 stop:1574 length:300 start_codon:yes stop_codon:yes gene_type:complete